MEENLYSEFPVLRQKDIIFIDNGNVINREVSLEKNGIKSGTTILMQYD